MKQINAAWIAMRKRLRLQKIVKFEHAGMRVYRKEGRKFQQ
jgi:hypothetical protein